VSKSGASKRRSKKRKPTRQEVKYYKDGAVCGKGDDPDRIIVSEFDESGLIARKAFRPRKRAKWLGVKSVRPTMWCIDPTCRYPLDGLMANRCPECGLAFDPNNPETYWQPPKPTKRISRSGAVLVFGFVLLAGMMVAHSASGGAPWFYEKVLGTIYGVIEAIPILALPFVLLWSFVMWLGDLVERPKELRVVATYAIGGVLVGGMILGFVWAIFKVW
jgi:hypothetical protein